METETLITRDWAATTFIVYEHRTLLLLHRKLNKWLPPGGHIDPHELPDAAALREVAEETGFKVALIDVGEALGPVQRLAQPLCILQEQISATHEHVDLIYVACVLEGDLQLAIAEHEQSRWYTWDELDAPEVAKDVCLLGRKAIELVTLCMD